MKTRAALFHEPSRPLAVEEVSLDDPGPTDVLVRMAAVGIRGSDLHVVRGEWRRPTPMILGHEGSGVVETVGAEVEGIATGDRVVLSWAPSCGECSPCRRGEEAALIGCAALTGVGAGVRAPRAPRRRRGRHEPLAGTQTRPGEYS